MPKYASQIDTSQIPVKGLTPQGGAVPPANPVDGELWVDESVSPPVLRFWNGTSWVRADGGDIPNGTVTNAKIASNAAIDLSKLAVDPLNRANHTGTQSAATISGLSAAVQTVRLDQMAAPTNPLNLNGQRATSAGDPTDDQDLVTRRYLELYIENRVTGQDWKDSVRVATTANITLSGTQTVDGVALDVGDRVLVKNQTNPAQNGIYVVTASAWVRAADANDGNKVTAGMTVPVEEGSSNGGSIWLLVAENPVDLGTSELTFTQVGAPGATYSAGTGLSLVGNTFSLQTPVSVANGGTGANTAEGARASLNTPGRFSVLLPELSPGVWVHVEHGLNDASPQRPTITIEASGEEIILDWKVVDADTVAVRSHVAFEEDELRIAVVA